MGMLILFVLILAGCWVCHKLTHDPAHEAKYGDPRPPVVQMPVYDEYGRRYYPEPSSLPYGMTPMQGLGVAVGVGALLHSMHRHHEQREHYNPFEEHRRRRAESGEDDSYNAMISRDQSHTAFPSAFAHHHNHNHHNMW